MQQGLTFRSYLRRISLIAALFFILPVAFSFGSNLSTIASYICSCLCFFILTIVSVKMLLGKRYVRYYATAFIVQIIIGLAHYLFFLDSNYFATSGSPLSTFWHEYLAVYNSVEQVVNDRHQYGLFYFNSGAWEVTHPEIWLILSWPITFLGVKWLNYAPLNTFSLLLASINLMVWYNYKHPGRGDKNGTRKYLMLFTAYFPQFILNDTVWRDPFGMALISIGLVLICLSDNAFSRGMSFIILAIFSFFQRTVYLLISGATLAFREVESRKKTYGIILLPIFVVLMIVLTQFFNSQVGEGYARGYVSSQTSVLTLPVKIIISFIGPFPWTQFFIVTKLNPATYFQLQDYATGVFQIGFLYSIIANWKLFSFRNLDYMTIMGFGIAFAGIMTTMMHIGYVSMGVFFTLPWFFNQIGSKFKKYFLLSFMSLFILNILTVVLGLSGMRNSLI